MKKISRKPATTIVTMTDSIIMNFSKNPRNHAPIVHCRKTLYGGGAGLAKKTMAIVSIAPLKRGYVGGSIFDRSMRRKVIPAETRPPAAMQASAKLIDHACFKKSVAYLPSFGGAGLVCCASIAW